MSKHPETRADLAEFCRQQIGRLDRVIAESAGVKRERLLADRVKYKAIFRELAGRELDEKEVA